MRDLEQEKEDVSQDLTESSQRNQHIQNLVIAHSVQELEAVKRLKEFMGAASESKQGFERQPSLDLHGCLALQSIKSMPHLLVCMASIATAQQVSSILFLKRSCPSSLHDVRNLLW